MTADPVRPQETLRDRIAQAIAERFTSPTRTALRNGRSYDPETFETYTEPVPMSERIESGAFVSFVAADGGMSFRAATGYELADAVLSIVEEETKALREELKWAKSDLEYARAAGVAYQKRALRFSALRDKVKALADEWDAQAKEQFRAGCESFYMRGTVNATKSAARLLRALVEPQGGEGQ